MSNMYIREYKELMRDDNHIVIQIPQEPAITDQKITYTTTAPSAAFNDATKFVCINLDDGGHIIFDSTPVATVAHKKLAAGVDYYFGVTKNLKVAAISAA